MAIKQQKLAEIRFRSPIELSFEDVDDLKDGSEVGEWFAHAASGSENPVVFSGSLEMEGSIARSATLYGIKDGGDTRFRIEVPFGYPDRGPSNSDWISPVASALIFAAQMPDDGYQVLSTFLGPKLNTRLTIDSAAEVFDEIKTFNDLISVLDSWGFLG